MLPLADARGAGVSQCYFGDLKRERKCLRERELNMNENVNVMLSDCTNSPATTEKQRVSCVSF